MPRHILHDARVWACLACLLAAVWLAGCAKPVAPPAPEVPVADLARIPQDPSFFASGPGKDVALLSPDLQAALAQDFIAAYFAPWQRSTRPAPRRDLEAVFRQYAANPGYGRDGRPNSPDFAPGLEAIADLPGYPNLNRPMITVAPADLRALPTMEPSYLDPTRPGEGYPFDYLQYSMIPQNTPVLARQVSRDGNWTYVEMTLGQGWMPSEALAAVDDAFMSAFQTGTYASLTREKLDIALDSGRAGSADRLRGGLGTVFPVTGQGPGGISGLAAVRQGAYARAAGFTLAPGAAAVIPMAATPAVIAGLARQIAGQTYGWGGIDAKRDCSLMLRDLMTPLGLWLPRNSAAQARAGSSIPLAGLSPEEKQQTILRLGVPFLTLITLPGHIGLYIGSFEGRPVMFHDIWGVRTLNAAGREGRRVIGKAVITTLTPGSELPDYDRDKNLVNRVDGMTFLGR